MAEAIINGLSQYFEYSSIATNQKIIKKTKKLFGLQVTELTTLECQMKIRDVQKTWRNSK
jgi:hypothetical protein